MNMADAPLFEDIVPGPTGGKALWVQTADNLRIRVGHWRPDDAWGTVLLMPGRTEYIEKYATTAEAFGRRGLATIAVDWRGQGLADRLLDDPLVGHVDTFSDYQNDVTAQVEAAVALDLPRPFFLLAHSMGGGIGLRALHQGVPVAAAAFSGPMWGIKMAPHMRPLAWALGRLMPALNRGHTLPPGTTPGPYVLSAPFEDNMLTTDRDMWDMMREHLEKHPELSLGGPSYIWLRQALEETNALHDMASPSVPCITFLGTHERIVHVGRVHERMARWPDGTLELVDGAEHEVLMEDPATREAVLDTMCAHFRHAADS